MTDLFNVGSEVVKNDKLVLRKITLENYRNITFKEIFLDGGNVLFSGKNELGKTNILESAYYSISGKLFDGSAKTEAIGIKPVGSDNDTKTSIKLEFEKDNFTFEKVVFENWTKKTNEYKGTETAYYVNGAVVKQNTQAMTILYNYLGLDVMLNKFNGSELQNLDLVALLYNTNYLKTVDYKLLRSLIIDVVGDVNVKDVINANPDKYGRLVEPLKTHNMELETLKTAKRTEKFGDKNKKGLNDLISVTEELKKSYELSASKEFDVEAVATAKKEIERIDGEIEELKLNLRQGNNEVVNSYDLKISNKKLEINKVEQDIRDKHQELINGSKDTKLDKEIADKKESISKLKEQRSELSEKINDINNQISTITSTISIKKRNIEQKAHEKQELATKYTNLKGATTTDSLTCPHCDKPFHLHETKEHKLTLNEKLSKIASQGKALKEEIEILNQGVQELEVDKEIKTEKLLKLQTERGKLDEKGIAIKAELDILLETLNKTSLNVPSIDFNVEPLLTLKSELNALEQARNDVSKNFDSERFKYQSQIDKLQQERETHMATSSVEEIIKNDKKRAEEKKQELQRLYKQLNDVEEILILISNLEKDMYELLDANVKNVFGENITFQLYKQNLDGSYDTRVCKMFVKDFNGRMVSLNTINTGTYPIRAIEFISRIKAHYGIKKSFVFIDELSSLDTQHRQALLNFGEQVLATKASETDKIVEERL